MNYRERATLGPPALGYFVRYIISIGSEEQMIWVAAWRIVAMMADLHVVRWPLSCMKLPRYAMGRASLTIELELPIALRVSRGSLK